ncbi:RNA-guided endonuclease TnpB family protein [Pectinatus brassicae]|uniref:RNA-guided endonuclease TnpB family protein n=2 Tax=Pectinatus brassicae TaxID=862415 RepID=UPI0018C78B76|nr:RNA-guided endonuclease TnpB family protein [Pectinatus brassicae]
MNKAYKFRIYPNTEQSSMIAKTFGCTRFIYNRMLSDRIEHYKTTKQSLKNTPAQYKAEFIWLKEVDSLALANTQLNLNKAYKSFFSHPDKGFPRFKSKKTNKLTYSTNNQKGSVRIEDGKIKLPKIGFVKIKQHRSIPENWKIKTVTISKNPANKYFVSVLFEYDNQVQEITPNKIVGLDFSMHELFVSSNGISPQYPRFYRQSLQKLAKEQRKLSLCKKGSNNRQKQRKRVALLHEKIANQRKDFQHKSSCQLADSYDAVCIEDLNMQSMSKSLNFGKSVADNGWGMFVSMLKYKLEERGKKLVKIDKFYPSSQICHICGYKNSDTKDLTIRQWECPECKSHHDRDINAAINIREEGRRILSA